MRIVSIAAAAARLGSATAAIFHTSAEDLARAQASGAQVGICYFCRRGLRILMSYESIDNT